MALNLITPEEKDKVLQYICEHFDLEEFSTNKSSDDFNNDIQIEVIKLKSILKQFERRGLIECTFFWDGDISIYLRMEAQDFLIRGGFVYKEGIFLAKY